MIENRNKFEISLIFFLKIETFFCNENVNFERNLFPHNNVDIIKIVWLYFFQLTFGSGVYVGMYAAQNYEVC